MAALATPATMAGCGGAAPAVIETVTAPPELAITAGPASPSIANPLPQAPEAPAPRIEPVSASQVGLPNWVPGNIGEAALVPMTNTLRDVIVIDGVLFRNESTYVYGAYSGGVYNRYHGRLGAHVIHGGGHSATQDNSVFIANYDTLRFERVGGPTVLDSFEAYEEQIRWGGFADDPTANPREVAFGVPGSAHTYDCLLVLPPSISGDPQGALIRPVSSAVGYAVSRETGWSHAFSFSSKQWSRFSKNSCQGWTPGGSCAYDTSRQHIWPLNSGNRPYLSYLDLNTRMWSNTPDSPQSVTGYPDMVYSAYCAHRDIVVMSTNVEEDASSRFYWFHAGSNGRERTPITFSSGGLPHGTWGKGSLLYVAELQKLIWFSQAGGDSYYELEVPTNPANAWSWTAKPITGAARPSMLTPAPYGSTYKRMDYAPQLKSLMWITGRRTTESYEFGGRVVAIRLAP